MRTLLIIASVCLLASTWGQAQSFCVQVGDGPASSHYNSITDIAPAGIDIAFLGWDGYYGREMRTMVGKTTAQGQLIWTRSFNLIDSAAYGLHEEARSVMTTANGDLVAVANGNSGFGIGRFDGATGALIQSKTYPNLVKAASLHELANGDIVVFCDANGGAAAYRLDANLNFIDGTTLGFVCKIDQVIKSPGGFFGIGTTGAPGSELFIFSLKNSLSVNWVRKLSTGNYKTEGSALTLLPDGSVLVVGQDGRCAPLNDGQILMVRYSAAGTLLNLKKIIDPTNCLVASDVAVAPNGNVVVVGNRAGASTDAICLTFSPTGSLIAGRVYSLVFGAIGVSSVLVGPQGEVIWGGTHDEEFSKEEGLLVRISANGTSCCGQDYLPVVVDALQPDQFVQHFLQTSLTNSPIIYSQIGVSGLVTPICTDFVPKTAHVEEGANTDEVTVSPNPARDQLQLFLPGDGPCDLQLLDLQGRLLRRLSLPAGRHSLPVADLESGVYLLRIQGAGGLSTHKLSIQH